LAGAAVPGLPFVIGHLRINWIENRRRLRHIGAVKRALILLALSVVAALAGCQKATPPPPPPPPPASAEEEFLKSLTNAQPKLATMKLYLGAEALDAELALTPRQIQTGMMFRTNIQDADAMLFNLRVPQRADFWMKNCPESISAAYITADGVIQEIHHLEKNDTNGVVAGRDDIIFVLETSEGWFDRHHVGVGMVIQSEKGSLAQVFLRH
jgi:hypothetical protein